ncbi:MAG TPA: YraN family protein [Selenomonadales bacterium]|nr:YraN family protein [Selenomonadales bacterium]
MQKDSAGQRGEQAAADYLQAAGYALLARNYRARTGEIDIIAEKGGTVVFVEVKARHSDAYGSPAEAVTYRKQGKILNTALCYLKQTGRTAAPLRFDVIEIYLGAGVNPRVNHIANAFGRR